MAEKMVREAWRNATIFLLVFVAVLLGLLWNQNTQISHLEDISYQQCRLYNDVVDIVNSEATLIEQAYNQEITRMTHSDCTIFGG